MASSITILILVFFNFPFITFSQREEVLPLPNGAFGPESLAFELDLPNRKTFYTGTADGLIWKYSYQGQVTSGSWSVFGFTSPNRSSNVCDGNMDPDKGPICGRPMGMGFHKPTQNLYVVDAYYGFLVVNSEDKQAKLIANSAEGIPFKSPDALDIDPVTGDVYFTDASVVYELRNFSQARLNNDSTGGRLMKYDPATKQISVLMHNLSGPLGVAVSSDGEYVLVSEAFANRTRKIKLKEKTLEFFRMFTPNNIKRSSLSDFWIVATMGRRRVFLGIYFNGGRGKRTCNFNLNRYGYAHSTPPSEVQEALGGLFVTSQLTDFIGVLFWPKKCSVG